ncbi:MAG: proton-conducting transporter membrane subunit [Hyphomonadaceae bacterium]|nr:proton-conducting transporter membrane subunit [Hyphomonadaceae bacterium]
MSLPMLLLAALLAPLAHGALVALAARPPGLRDLVHITGAATLAVICAALMARVGAGARGEVVIAEPLPGLELALAADPLGVAFAAAAAALGALCALYTVGYVRMTRDPAPARFMAFAAFALAATVGVALAANLFTFFVFYEALCIATFPLMAHRGGRAASHRAAAGYLVLMLALAMGALLPAIIWTSVAAGDLRFADGGVLAGRIDAASANVLLALFVAGIGMAALFPAHRWITAAAGASPPAAALVFAVTAASAGGFGVLRVAAHVFGPALAQAQTAATAILALATATLLGASLAAFARRNLSERLSYLCVAQLAAVTAGAMLGPAGDADLAAGWFAAALQLVAYATATATLCFAIGAIDAAHGAAEIDDLAGLGRRMPWVFAALACGALSFAGAPPLAGAFPKLWLMIAAADRGALWVGLAIAAGSLLSFAALTAPVVRALFAPVAPEAHAAPDRAPILIIAPTVAAGASTLLLLVWLNPIARFLGDLRGGAP